MRTSPPGLIVPGVEEAAAPVVQMTVDVDALSEPIRGRRRVEGGHSRPFCGWVELAAALEQARTSMPIQWQPAGGATGLATSAPSRARRR